MVSRGEVWWATPEGAKRRPYLVLMRDTTIPHVRRVICVPATSRVRGIATEVALDEGDGMPRPCVLSPDNIALVAHERFEERICTLTPRRMREVCRAIAIATGCA